MKVIFVGDAHLKGMDDPNQKELRLFFDSLKGVDALVVLGDLFDFWMGYNEVVYYHYLPVLNAMKRLRDQGTKIVYIEGNHDFMMGRFFTDVLGASVYPDDFIMEVDGRMVYLSHGDTINMTRSHAFWRRLVRSWVFKGLTTVLTPGAVWKVASVLSRTSRTYNKKGHVIETLMKEFARGKITAGLDAVVLGHSHVADVDDEVLEDRPGVYANPGAWCDTFTYLLYENGRFTVQRWKG